jgi:transcriptional regulator with XRE-family HTH domain
VLTTQGFVGLNLSGMGLKIAKGTARRPHFLREWRKYRGLSLERLADRIETTKASISRIENGKQPYSQEFLEKAAEALMCEPGDLLMRNPLDTEAPWSIWETLKPVEKRQAIEVIKALKKASDPKANDEAA